MLGRTLEFLICKREIRKCSKLISQLTILIADSDS